MSFITLTLKRFLTFSGLPDALNLKLKTGLTFQNPKWLENERLHRWNKDVPKFLTFFSQTNEGALIVPRGLTRQAIVMCRNEDLPHELVDRRRELPEIDLKFSGALKPFQETAVCRMLARDFGVLNAPTASGKTVMALYMIAQRKQPAMIVVHTRDLANQWVDRIQTFLNLPETDIGFIGGGKKQIGRPVTVAMIQSLYKCAKDAARHTGFLIVDECHRAPSRTFTEAVTSFDSRYMLGLSATPWRRDGLSKLIFWHLGDTHHNIKPDDLVAGGHILKAEVVIRETDFNPFSDPTNEYSKMLSELTADKDRNLLICSDVAGEIRKSDGICLVLSDRKKHCENLQFILKYKFSIASELLTGDTPAARRQGIVQRLKNKEAKVLVATGQLIGEGFDFSELSTLFIATPVRFSGRLLQYLGRILRPAGTDKQPRVFDYVDVNVGPLKHAARARQQVYGFQAGTDK